MPISGSQKSLMEARSGIARAGAVRSDYFRQFPVMTIAGVDRTNKIWKHSLSIKTVLTQQPNTGTVRLFGIEPAPGQQVIIGSGAISNRVFGGSVLRATQLSVRGNAIDLYDVELTDWVRDLNKRLVFKSYAAGVSASAVFSDLTTSYTTGFSTAKVKSGAPNLTGPLVFLGTKVADAYTQLMDATPGWHWKVDPDQILHWYDTEAVQQPTGLSATNYLYDLLDYTLDVSQIRTRFYGWGNGAQTTAPVAALATSIPVDECGWYSNTGGMLLTPYADQVTYTGLSASSGPGNITGVSGLIDALKQGDKCAVFVTVNDIPAQTALAAIEGGFSDGIREGTVQDPTWSLATTTAQANAALAAFKNQDVRGTYETRDKLTKVGAVVPISITRRNISTSVTLQTVTRHLIAKNQWGYTCEFARVWSDLIDLITGTVQAA